MARRIEFEGKVHEFPDNASDEEVRSVLEGGSKPKPTHPHARVGQAVSDFGGNVLRSGKEFVGGVGRALADPVGTVDSALNAVTGGASKLLPGKVAPKSEEAFDALTGTYKKRYGSLGQAAKTAYEDPIGALADVSSVAGGVGGVMRAAGAATRAAPLARAGAAVSKAGAAVDPMNAVKAPLRAAGKLIPTPERMYQSALKPAKKFEKPIQDSVAAKLGLPAGMSMEDAMIQQALERNIPVTGLRKAERTVEQLNKQIGDKIAAGAKAGDVVDPRSVARRVDELEPMMETQALPAEDLAAIRGVKKDFLKEHTEAAPYTKIEPSVNEPGRFVGVGTGETKTVQPIPSERMQAIKQGTNARLRKKYGQLSDAAVEGEKSLVRGMKEDLEKLYPEIGGLNANEGVVINLEEALRDFAHRTSNKDLFGIGTALKGALGGAMTGEPMGAVAGAILGAAMESPLIKSRIAIARHHARKMGVGKKVEGAARAITPATQIRRGVRQEEEPGWLPPL